MNLDLARVIDALDGDDWYVRPAPAPVPRAATAVAYESPRDPAPETARRFVVVGRDGSEIARYSDVVTAKRALDRHPSGHRLIRADDGRLLAWRGAAPTEALLRWLERAMRRGDG